MTSLQNVSPFPPIARNAASPEPERAQEANKRQSSRAPLRNLPISASHAGGRDGTNEDDVEVGARLGELLCGGRVESVGVLDRDDESSI